MIRDTKKSLEIMKKKLGQKRFYDRLDLS